jgi:hypothetical protein
MEDYLNYMNSVSESESVLNQVNSLRENIVNQADLKAEDKDQFKQEITGIPSELLISTAGAYLGKKALSYVASKIGVSDDTVSKFVSGDIEGGLKQGLGEVASKNLPVGGQGSPAEDPELQEPPMGPEQEGDIELQDLTPPSQDEALSMLAGEERPTITSEDLPEGAGTIEDLQTPIMDAGEAAADVGESVISSASDVITSGLSSVASAAGDIVSSGLGSVASTAGDIVSSGLSTVASSAGEVAADVAVGGLEAAGAALDATGIGAIAGAFLGLVGGIVGFFEGSHHDAPQIVQPFEPILNPSSQIL